MYLHGWEIERAYARTSALGFLLGFRLAGDRIVGRAAKVAKTKSIDGKLAGPCDMMWSGTPKMPYKVDGFC